VPPAPFINIPFCVYQNRIQGEWGLENHTGNLILLWFHFSIVSCVYWKVLILSLKNESITQKFRRKVARNVSFKEERKLNDKIKSIAPDETNEKTYENMMRWLNA
jgi:hypothetical protein